MSSKKCDACLLEVTPDQGSLQCPECRRCFHFGDCSGILKESFKKYTIDRKTNWRCTECRRGGGGAATPTEDDGAKGSLLTDKGVCEKIMEQLKPFVENLFKSQIKVITEDIDSYKKSVDFCSSKIDDVLEEFKKMKCEMREQTREVQVLREEKKQLCSEVAELRAAIEQQAQYARNRNLVFDGVPVFHNENLATDFIPQLSRALNIKIDFKSDVQAIHRLPTVRQRAKGDQPILVQFSNRQLRDQVLSVGRKKKLLTTDLFPNEQVNNLYINEHLTPFYKKLWQQTLTKKKEVKFEYAWIKNSKIFVKKTEDSTPIIIKNYTDLQDLDRHSYKN